MGAMRSVTRRRFKRMVLRASHPAQRSCAIFRIRSAVFRSSPFIVSTQVQPRLLRHGDRGEILVMMAAIVSGDAATDLVEDAETALEAAATGSVAATASAVAVAIANATPDRAVPWSKARSSSLTIRRALAS